MNIVWRQVDVPRANIAEWLTLHNFQPGKFHIVNLPLSPDVRIVYVEGEG